MTTKRIRYTDLIVSGSPPPHVDQLPDTLELADGETIIGITEHQSYSGAMASTATAYARVWIAKDAT